jgi:deoxyribodipyrimidine photo-lyase
MTTNVNINNNNNNKYNNGLFIFRRDFRIIDNNGLNLLAKKCKHLYTIFIFTPEQVTGQNHFKSDNSVQFMIESLQDLASKISQKGGQLMCFYGDNENICKQIIDILDIEIVCFNLDYSPYAIERDMKLTNLCESESIMIDYGTDYYLHEPGTILNGSGQPYQKFTPFYNTAMKQKVVMPVGPRKIPFSKTTSHMKNMISLDSAMKQFVGNKNETISVNGGRDNAIKQMKIAATNIKSYEKTRDELSHSTSRLSAYIKFGCVSVREVYKAFRSNHSFIRQLIWRDFYANILFSFPYVLGSAMKPNYNKIKWHHNATWFKKWCDGDTGFPVVDAGMRQLNTTGYMENRARLIVMSFLIKTLLIDWKLGEKYFATKLTDYDPASNNGNIQWLMGGGSDSMPYFRIFNPWTQQEEHDQSCKYIKTWIPELASLDPKIIHNWETEYVNYKDIKYSKPICDYAEQKDKCLKMYKDALY